MEKKSEKQAVKKKEAQAKKDDDQEEEVKQPPASANSTQANDSANAQPVDRLAALKRLGRRFLDLIPSLPQMPELPMSVQEDKEDASRVTKVFKSMPQVTKMISIAIVFLSLIAQSQQGHEFLALQPSNLTFHNDMPPMLQTLATWCFCDSSLIHLMINLFIMNYFGSPLEPVWTPGQFVNISAISAIVAAFVQSLTLLLLTASTGMPFVDTAYCSVAHLVLVVLMGLSLSYPERQFDSQIPFIWGNFTLAYKYLPMTYMGLSFGMAFLFETSIEWQLPISFYSIWLCMRFVMKRKSQPELIGEPGSHFALSTFHPEAIKPYIDQFSDATFTVCNCCGQINFLQRMLRPSQANNTQRRQDALDMLDKEIDSLTDKKGSSKKKQASSKEDKKQENKTPDDPELAEVQIEFDNDEENESSQRIPPRVKK